MQQWADITLAAVERGIVRESPQAYFMHYIREAAARRTTPPDWWREFRRKEYNTQRQKHSDQSDAEFEEYLRSEAQETFARVTQRLFNKLREAGQSESDARIHAESTARMHLRRDFHKNHSKDVEASTARLGDLLEKRYKR